MLLDDLLREPAKSPFHEWCQSCGVVKSIALPFLDVSSLYSFETRKDRRELFLANYTAGWIVSMPRYRCFRAK